MERKINMYEKENDICKLSNLNMNIDPAAIKKQTNPIYFQKASNKDYLANTEVPSAYEEVFSYNKYYNIFNNEYGNKNIKLNIMNNRNWFDAMIQQFEDSLRASISDTLLNGSIGNLLSYVVSDDKYATDSAFSMLVRQIFDTANFYICGYENAKILENIIKEKNINELLTFFIAAQQRILTRIAKSCSNTIFNVIFNNCKEYFDYGLNINFHFDLERYLSDISANNIINKYNLYNTNLFNMVYCEFINKLNSDMKIITEIIDVQFTILINNIISNSDDALSKDRSFNNSQIYAITDSKEPNTIEF